MWNTNDRPNPMSIRTSDIVTLLGPSKARPQNVDETLTRGPFLVAADGGAREALARGLMPRAVVGDLDSLDPETGARLPADIVHRIDEQETTDFEKCLRTVDAPLILAIGFTGQRLDHELAVYNALVRHPDRRCIVIGARDIVFSAPRRLSLPVAAGTRLSLFPLDVVRGSSTGLQWPIDGITFSPGGRIGTSNRATGAVGLRFDSDGMLVILPRHALDIAITALHPGRGVVL